MSERMARMGVAGLLLLLMAGAACLAYAGLGPYLIEPRHEGKRLSEWLNGLESQSVEMREETREALRAMGTRILPKLEEMMNAPETWWRRKLAEVAGLGPEMQMEVVPVFQRRWQAVRALPVVGPEAVEVLVKALEHEDRLVRMGAALGLGELQARPELAVPALMAVLQDQGSGVGVYAAEALGRFGVQAGMALPLLMEVLEEADSQLRARIVMALKQIDPEALSAQ
jgi:HEAT repeat protein